MVMGTDFTEGVPPQKDADGEKGRELKALIEEIRARADAPEELIKMLESIPEGASLEEELVKIQEQLVKARAVYAAEICGLIHDFFNKRSWHYVNMDTEGMRMLTAFKMRNTTVRLYIFVEPEAECLQFNVILPVTCEEEYRLVVSDYITELNRPLRYGAFQMNKEDGEISYRYSVSYKGMLFSEAAFENYIDACTITVDKEIRALSKLATGRLTDEEKRNWFLKIKVLASALSE